MATMTEIKYFQADGQIPDTNLKSNDWRSGISVLNTSPNTAELVIDDNAGLTIKVAPFTAKTIPITIKKRVVVTFTTTTEMTEDEYLEVALFESPATTEAGTYGGHNYVEDYLRYLRQLVKEGKI